MGFMIPRCSFDLVPEGTSTCMIKEAKVYTVLMEDEPTFSLSNKQKYHRVDDDYIVYKEKISNYHTIFLESHLPEGSYTKLYSYTHLLNGFAVHVTSKEDLSTLRNATGVRLIHEDVKIEKLTAHTPDFLGISAHVWPRLGGAESSGEGFVIGFVDTGINPEHPSFMTSSSSRFLNSTKFKGKCTSGEKFPSTACNGKILGAQYFVHGAMANDEFNATRDVPSPYDADDHGRQVIHTASIAAGSSNVSVIVNGFDYGTASGMAPGARIAVYKAIYAFGVYMSDVVAAVDQAVEDGVDILSLSAGPSSVPSGDSAFLIVVELQLLFTVKAGVLVVQVARFRVQSFLLALGSLVLLHPSLIANVTIPSYWEMGKTSVDPAFLLSFNFAAPAEGEINYQVAAAADVCVRNATAITIDNCQNPELFIQTLVYGKLIICTYTFEYEYEPASIAAAADTMKQIGAAGPDVQNALMQAADVLKPNVMAPGSSIWASWSLTVKEINSKYIRGQNFALISGTSMATPHIAGIAAMIKQKHPKWGPDAITSAMMTTADRTDHSGAPILAESLSELTEATPFDFGAGSINASQAIKPGLIFNATFKHYVEFLCAVPGLDRQAVKRAVGVIRYVKYVSDKDKYTVHIKEPLGVNVTVVPETFKIKRRGSKRLRLLFRATETTNAYTFGEMVLKGKQHTVRVPLAVYVASASSS
ncbi:hypothetical protein F3Y22_tig00010865pilonHSYRG00018 [Hibiscus syriacus]|uniref:Subtilisin-like protease SBT2.5 n=1 Tax=Hibiscus syriacus TaxID=106335 RepID=A0A6A3C9G2_HIBSY|nr:hypothetical protein F3Y22_tig00010865pilonHSYRG00018 [Hibiscus syriacus]